MICDIAGEAEGRDSSLFFPRLRFCMAPPESGGFVRRGHDYASGVVVYSRARMKLSLARLVATLLLSGQVLPVASPLLCDQVQRATPANCDQQMASHPSGPVVAATTHATPCANSAFCAATATAVAAPGGAVSVSVRESHIVGFGISTFAPADPQPPLSPPPQA